MIIFRLILAQIKKKLGLECSNFDFRRSKKKKLYIIFVFLAPWAAGCRAAQCVAYDRF